MSTRYSWKGFLQLSLVTIPVKAYPVAVSGSEIHLHQLHGGCQSRVKYQKICPRHGELAAGDIVSGFEFAQDRYVVIDPDELDKLRTDRDKAIQIDALVAAGQVDPLYTNGKHYYLLPDGPVAQKSYAVFWRALVEEGCHALAEVVMHGKEHVVWLRPLEHVLVLSQLCFAHQVTKPAEFVPEVVLAEPVTQEMQLMRMLLARCREGPLDLAKYPDRYHAKLRQLIEAKVTGQEIVAAPANAPLAVLNLVEALQQSLAKTDTPAKNNAATAKKKPAARKAKTVCAKKTAVSA